MKPEDFIINSEYATLKNDSLSTVSVTLPSSVVIPASGYATYSQEIDAGVAGSSIRSMIMSTKDNRWYTLNTVQYIYLSGATPGGSYEVYVSLTRVSSTRVRLLVTIPNALGVSKTVTGLSQTITAKIATFLPPFV